MSLSGRAGSRMPEGTVTPSERSPGPVGSWALASSGAPQASEPASSQLRRTCLVTVRASSREIGLPMSGASGMPCRPIVTSRTAGVTLRTPPTPRARLARHEAARSRAGTDTGPQMRAHSCNRVRQIWPHRYRGQRHTTVMARVPRHLVDQTLWPEYQQISDALQIYLASATASHLR